MKRPLKFPFFLLVVLGLWVSPAVTQSMQSDKSYSLGVRAISTYNGVLADPNDAMEESTRVAIDLFQESLVDWRRSASDDPELIGELAESYRSLADEGTPNIYVFNLRSGTKWHDDVEFTAEDVIFTFDAIRNPELGSPYKTRLDQALAASGPNDSPCADQTAGSDQSKRVVRGSCPYYASGPSTLVVYGSGISDEDFYASLVVPIIPKHIWETVEISREAWKTDPGSTGLDPDRVVGTGQYKFVSRTPYNNCWAFPESNGLPSMPDEDVVFSLNEGYGSDDGAWREYQNFVLRVYECDTDSLTIDDRINRGILDGAINASYFTELRNQELPPWEVSDNPSLITSLEDPTSEAEDSRKEAGIEGEGPGIDPAVSNQG